MHTTQEGPQRPHSASLADQLIDASGAGAADRITIAGGRHLDLLLSLFSRGFTHAACQAVNQDVPHDGEPAPDVLLIPSIASEEELLAVLARLGRQLRPGGALVLRAAGGGNCGQKATRLRRLLAERGFDPASWTIALDVADELILCAHKRRPVAHAQAA
jgi:hypothetical protein